MEQGTTIFTNLCIFVLIFNHKDLGAGISYLEKKEVRVLLKQVSINILHSSLDVMVVL